MLFLVVITNLSGGVALSWMATCHPAKAKLERISGVLLIVAFALLGAALPTAHH